MSEFEQLLRERLETEKAAAWEAGFYAGQQYGCDLERYRLADDYEGPSRPENPYRRLM